MDGLQGEHEVFGIDLREPKIPAHRGMIEFADIRDTEAMAEECHGIDVVIHTAAQVSVQKSTEEPAVDADLNVIGTISVLQAAKRAGVRTFVHISSAAVYGDPRYVPVDEGHPCEPKSFYGASKLAGEHYVQAFHHSFGMDYIILRPFNFYSPRADPKSPYSGVITKFSERARRGENLLIEGDGMQTRDFIHATDVSRMIKIAIESDVRNVTMNCGSGQGTTIKEVAETIAEVGPRRVGIEHVHPRTSDIRHSVAEVSRARQKLGFTTSVSLREGLMAFFE